MTYNNPKWLQILIYFGLVFIPVFAIGNIYFIIDGIQSNNLFLVTFFSIGTIFFLYMEYLGFGLAKFIRAKISLSEDGIKVLSNKSLKKYSWDDVGRVKNSIRLQLYTVFDKNDHPIFIVDHMMPGFNDLKNKIETKINI